MPLHSRDLPFYNTIDDILWHDWDPIGVNDIPEVRDEYQSYTIGIFNLVKSGQNREDLAKYLPAVVGRLTNNQV